MTDIQVGDIVELIENFMDFPKGSRWTVKTVDASKPMKTMLRLESEIDQDLWAYTFRVKKIESKVSLQPMPEVGQIWRDTEGRKQEVLWIGARHLVVENEHEGEETYEIKGVRENWTRVMPVVLPGKWRVSGHGTMHHGDLPVVKNGPDSVSFAGWQLKLSELITVLQEMQKWES